VFCGWGGIQILDKNGKFGQKLLTKIEIFGKNWNLRQKSKVWRKTEIFNKNRKFGEKLKFSTKIESLEKN